MQDRKAVRGNMSDEMVPLNSNCHDPYSLAPATDGPWNLNVPGFSTKNSPMHDIDFGHAQNMNTT